MTTLPPIWFSSHHLQRLRPTPADTSQHLALLQLRAHQEKGACELLFSTCHRCLNMRRVKTPAQKHAPAFHLDADVSARPPRANVRAVLSTHTPLHIHSGINPCTIGRAHGATSADSPREDREIRKTLHQLTVSTESFVVLLPKHRSTTIITSAYSNQVIQVIGKCCKLGCVSMCVNVHMCEGLRPCGDQRLKGGVFCYSPLKKN